MGILAFINIISKHNRPVSQTRHPALTKAGKGEVACYYIVMTHIHNTKYLRPTRKSLRKNMTEEEVILWSVLQNNKCGYKFRRQHSIGRFIADFFCPVKRLIIELDGGQHLDNKEYDEERTDRKSVV